MNVIAKIVFCLATMTCFASNEMTLDEKIGQLLMVRFNGKEANEDAKALVQEVHVGGVIFYNWANGLDSPEQVRSLNKNLQQLTLENQTPIPLLIAVDQEGGLVSRLNRGFTIFPGNMALGKTNDPDLAEEAAYAMGQELMAVGVNMNLAPVVDINNNERNPVIGIRSFGDSPKSVSIFAKKALDGYHKAGIITSLKHFPGHGDVEIDSHENLPIVNKSIDQLCENELLPFSELCDLADTVMTAHIMVPSLDSENCATLSRNILLILRNLIGFQGVIISDSLLMEGVLKNCDYSVEEAAIRAFNAGCDILNLGGRRLFRTRDNLDLTVREIQKIHQALVHAVKTNRISEERVNQSLDRILSLKKRYKLSSSVQQIEPTDSFEHREISKKIAALALHTIQNGPIPSIKESRIALFAPEFLRETILQTEIASIGKKTSALFYQSLIPCAEEIFSVQKLVNQSDMIIFCSYNAWKNPAQTTLLQILCNIKKPMILISLRDPLDTSLFPNIPLIISTFSPTAPSIQAASDLLNTGIY